MRDRAAAKKVASPKVAKAAIAKAPAKTARNSGGALRLVKPPVPAMHEVPVARAPRRARIAAMVSHDPSDS